MTNFQKRIELLEFGKDLMVITPAIVMSPQFLEEYNKVANIYAKFNIEHNIGNNNYKKSTTVAPFCLQQMVKEAYLKK